MKTIRKATPVKAFGKFLGQGWFVILHDGRDNEAMGILPRRGVYKTEEQAQAVATQIVGTKYEQS